MAARRDPEKLLEKYKVTPEELEVMLKSKSQAAPSKGQIWQDYFGKHAVFGIISDTHIGHEMFDKPFAENVAKQFKARGIDTVYHCGDILEGMSGRPGHIYELSEIGFEQQMDAASEVIGDIFGDFYVRGITGNHDQWYIKKNNGGVNPGVELEHRLENYVHLGDNEADIEIGPNTKMKLFHAGDGSAYATSYKMQKLVESFTGDEKPHIVVEGHYHKALYMFLRNVHCIEGATLCGQTSWMRGKKIPAHKGAWIIDVEMGKGGIGKFSPEFLPGYK